MPIRIMAPQVSEGQRRRTLLNIEEDFWALNDLLDETGGEITDPETEQAFDQWFAELGEERDRKLQGYLAVYREQELQLAALQAEHDRLSKRIQTRKGQMDYMKRRLLEFMQRHGLKTIGEKKGIYRASRCKNGGLAPLIVTEQDPKRLPEEYRVEKVIYSANSDKIRKDLADGKELAFASLGERGEHLRIS